ncbi:MAG: DUF4326 domain-containing protein [Acidobacteria bacterium]|nr:DUF4326 domain-containing protein [Acidobacteriota bacterium]
MDIRDASARMPTVRNLRDEPELRAALARAHVHGDAVLIDRRTRWGNSFRIGPGTSRAQAVELYRADLWRRVREGTITLEDLAALAPCRLACWCRPKACHGDVLARAAAWAAARLAGRAP